MLAVPKGSKLTLSYIASSAPARVEPFAVLRSLRTGKITVDRAPTLTSFTTDRTRQAAASEGELTSEDSEVVGAGIEGASALKRGQFYAELEYRVSGDAFVEVCRGYQYAGFTPHLGDRIEPLSGRGFLQWLEVFIPDRAGNGAAVDFALAATNAYRKVYGLAWFYHCSADVAGRTFNTPSLQNPGGAKPTGWTTSGNSGLAWSFAANITLTADEEGMFYVNALEGKDGRAAHVDNGAITVISSASNPTPFPLLVTEDELAVMRFPAIAAGEALDTHSAYLLVEEWLDL